MRIEQMFKDDINRKINGVVQVEQETERVLIQELDEYVVKNISSLFSIITVMHLIQRPMISAYGYPVSLEAVNLTS